MYDNAACIEAMKNTRKVRATLKDMVNCFVKRLPDVVWFAHAGTALSAYYGRNRKTGGIVLPGDNDIDIGVLAETVDLQTFIAEFDAAGFKPDYLFADPMYPSTGIVVRFSKRQVPIDFYWMYGRGRKRWWLTAPRVPHVLPAYLFEELEARKFLNVDIPVPHPLEAYCCNTWKKVGDRFPAPPEGESLTVAWDWPIKP